MWVQGLSSSVSGLGVGSGLGGFWFMFESCVTASHRFRGGVLGHLCALDTFGLKVLESQEVLGRLG